MQDVPPCTTVAGVPARVVGQAGCDQPALSMNQILSGDLILTKAETAAARAGGALTRLAAKSTGQLITLFTRPITALRPIWLGSEPLPRAACVFRQSYVERRLRRPLDRTSACPAGEHVACRGCRLRLASRLRAFVGRSVFNAVLIDRRPEMRIENLVEQMILRLAKGIR